MSAPAATDLDTMIAKLTLLAEEEKALNKTVYSQKEMLDNLQKQIDEVKQFRKERQTDKKPRRSWQFSIPFLFNLVIHKY